MLFLRKHHILDKIIHRWSNAGIALHRQQDRPFRQRIPKLIVTQLFGILRVF